jgi:uncharacterized membrane protein YdbT with pleckstrin-like domain
MLHEHPIKIFRYTAKSLWLLIFPLLRSAHFFPFSASAVAAWLHGAWFDLLICILILAYGVLRWFYCGFTYNTEVIRRQSGFLVKQEMEIPCCSITSVTEEHAFFLRPFGAVRVSFHTGAEDITGSDMQLLLYRADFIAIRRVIPLLHPKQHTKQHSPHITRLFLFSFLFSSSLSGAIYAAAIFFQGGRISRDILESLQAEALLLSLTDQAAAYFQGIPRLAILLSILILATWLISFLGNLLRYSRFRFSANDITFSVHRGLFSRYHYHIRRGAVNYIDIRQNLMMKILRLMSVHISCPGYGNQKNELPVLIPLMKQSQAPQFLTPLLKQRADSIGKKKPKQRFHFFRLWIFVWQPLILMAAVGGLILLVWHFFPQIYQQFSFFGWMLLLPCGWFLLIRIVSAFRTRMWLEQDHLYLHYSSGFVFHTIVTPVSNIVAVTITRTQTGKQMGICNVFFYLQGKHLHRHKLTGVSEKVLQQIQAAIAEIQGI